ncbi:Uridylate kinase [Hartmannibacter diazotrophicus]|uniref:Uridylate kinase n=1 Tax=Hartmannibacter diazotrophicus TaxID=1482074 RepID=A0A2C9D3N4_9HYPH|nr:UMP kinase [Hartmannibacter diazotrophicus]SON54937.1 Uridylate kinase [Hartmannibacter diazotrophicus]
MASTPSYKRVLLKLSGEALMGDKGFGIDSAVVERVAGEVVEARRLGVEVGIVVGGGNIFRGVKVAAEGGDRTTGDYLGMLATVMNGLSIRSAIEKLGVRARVFSAIDMPVVCSTFTQRDARKAFEDGSIVIFVGGTGNPFFTTDSGAALRAAEMGCDGIFKGTQVDGVYSADPKKDPTAERYETLSHQEVLSRGLEVMDAAAIALARDNRIPVIVFSIHQPGAFVDVLKGEGRCTRIAD